MRVTQEVSDKLADLSECDLVIVGRFVYSDGMSYYMTDRRWQFLRDLAAPFNSATYVCFVEDTTEQNDLTEIDTNLINIEPNKVWNSDAALLRRLMSLKRDAVAIDGDRLVTYTYLPGTYSFLLAPIALARGDVNVAYFGKEAGVTTSGIANGSFLTQLQRQLYPRAQRYILNRSDVAFVRDPRVMQQTTEAEIVLSKPITNNLAEIDAVPSVNEINDPVELLYVGSFRQPKGHEYLIDAFAELHAESDREYRLRLVGDGETRSRMEQQVEQRGLTAVVDFRGYLSDPEMVCQQYEECDVFVLPSLTEGFPRVLNEAMAMGVPVVATRAGGIPELLNDGEHALLVEPRNPTELASAVRKIVTNEELRERIVKQAGEFTRSQTGDPVEQHLDAIHRVLS